MKNKYRFFITGEKSNSEIIWKASNECVIAIDLEILKEYHSIYSLREILRNKAFREISDFEVALLL